MSDNEQPDRRRIFRLRTSRMEAFSDGIFAIASILLVLDLAVPRVGPDVAQKLHDQWPIYLAYLVSFLSIGQAWLNHSVITEYLDRADSILLRLNLVLLFFASLLPFPTHMVAEYLRTENAERIAVTVCGLNCWPSAPLPASPDTRWRNINWRDNPKRTAISAKLDPSLASMP